RLFRYGSYNHCINGKKLIEGINMTNSVSLAAVIIFLLIPGSIAGENESSIDSDEADAIANITLQLGFDSFPLDHTCDGSDASPKIGIGGFSSASLALILEDPDAPSGTFYHWLIWNIPAVDAIAEGIAKDATIDEPFPAVQGINSFGETGYAGPCPPPGKPHRYFFRAYGLDEMLDLAPGSTVEDLERAMQGHILQRGETMATYGR
ncbi:MAG TPA: YbhB/YbcL family Raf kinase inhibitor-like protein, partial [Methanothrix sp.]|nr:YbhB/YbcL family Raf kinase inhibitor-like protein [Methanothrix sp.]